MKKSLLTTDYSKSVGGRAGELAGNVADDAAPAAALASCRP